MIGPLTDRQNASVEEVHTDLSSVDTTTTNNNQTEEQIVEKFVLPIAPPDYGGSRSIALSYLLDFSIQFTYHELSILTELLQKKSESDRKISLAHFARSTRLIFMKLYALVKWVKKSKKFEELDNICFFLDQQSEYFVETADRFAHVARAELIFAGLPLYQVSKAVDVLSNGSYPHLPQAIKKKHIQERPLNQRQNTLTLQWLNNSIQYRLTQEAANLPSGITKIDVKNGMAMFTVPNEFVFKATIFPVDSVLPVDVSEVESWRWTILDVEMLVADYEIGCGSSLMHSMQKPPLIGLCQAQITQTKNDIENVYKVLHEFSIKLQLDILFCQVDYLSTTIARSYVKVKQYDPKKGTLTIAYWTKNPQSTNYSIKIEKSQINLSAGLRLTHYPYNINLPTLHNETTPNFHRLFSRTILLRCQKLLNRVQQKFNNTLSPFTSIRLLQNQQSLTYQLLNFSDFSIEESLQICVNTFIGEIKCKVGIIGDNKNLVELEKQLNNDLHFNPSIFMKCLQKLQIQLLMKRYEESMDENILQLIKRQRFPIEDKLKEFTDEFICMQMIHESKIYLVIEFDHNVDVDIQVKFTLFDFNGPTFKSTSLDQQEIASMLSSNDLALICNRNQLRRMLSSIVDKIMHDQISGQLMESLINVEKRKIPPTNEYAVKLKSFSKILDKLSDKSLENYVDCYIHQKSYIVHQNSYYNYQNYEPFVSWSFECSLKGRSSTSLHLDACILKNRIPGHIEALSLDQNKSLSIGNQIATQIEERLKSYSALHDVFRSFAVAYDYYFKQACTITSCTYSRLCIAYGETRNNVLSVVYKPKTQNFSLSFIHTTHSDPSNLYVQTMHTTLWNPHHLFYQTLNEWFNRDQDLVSLVNYLNNTYASCLGIYHFSTPHLRSLKPYSQMMGIDEKNFAFELQPFFKVLSPTRLRIVYGVVHLEFNLLAGNRVVLDSFVITDKQTHNFQSVPLFYEFWHSHARGNVIVTQKTIIGSTKSSAYLKTESNYIDSMSPLTPRMSSNGVSTPTPTTSQDKVSPPPQKPVSAPAASQLGTPPKQEQDIKSTLQSLLLDSNALQNAMLPNKNNSNLFSSSFEEYLHSINFFHTVGSSLSHSFTGKEKRPSFPLTDIRYGLDYIEMSALGVANTALNVDPWNVRIYLYLCNQTFGIRCNLTFTGLYVPDLKYVHIFERYFETRIVPHYNEMELLSFTTACRVMADGVFRDIARIMDSELTNKNREMDPTIARPFWKTNLLLSQLSINQSQERVNLQAPSRRFIGGLIISDNCKHLLITLSIRSNLVKKNQKPQVKRVELIYVVPSNLMTIRKVYTGQRAFETEQKAIEVILNEVNKMESNECRLWPAIQNILSKFRP